MSRPTKLNSNQARKKSGETVAREKGSMEETDLKEPKHMKIKKTESLRNLTTVRGAVDT